jgi:isoaspartyl peptidase/L-asparaginase-like protein (Ntn-hydrolase superfamily)
MPKKSKWSIVLHGGAGPLYEDRISREEAALREALKVGCELLEGGASSLDVAEVVLSLLECSGAFIAGRGASPNMEGIWELDASIMDGATQKAGAIAAITGFAPIISLAKAVMERTNNVLLVGQGAAEFATNQGFTKINAKEYYMPVSNRVCGPDDLVHGTVGIVVMDTLGRLVAATSTGGTLGKRWGRIGDTPIIGSGTWADERIAVSCTGQGEFFLRTCAAHYLAMEVALTNESPYRAAVHTIEKVGGLGGEGGVIFLDATGRAGTAFSSEAMRWAHAFQGSTPVAQVSVNRTGSISVLGC